MDNHASPTRPRLVMLTRISKDRDNESSTETQPFEMRQWADRNGCEIVESFTEVARSGFKRIPRPYLADALAMVRNGFADGIIVWKIDRFTRKGAQEIFAMLATLNQRGFLIASQDDIDTRRSGMADVIKLTVLAEVAKAESQAKSDRSAAWHRGRARKILPPVGRKPFGYDRPTPNVLTVNEAEAKQVRKMVKDVLAGSGVRAIVREMNVKFPRPDGEPAWTHRGVSYVLKSATIAGGRMIDGVFVAGGWEAIVDRKTWENVNAILADPSRRTITTNEPAWMLTGILACGTPDCEGKYRAKNHPKGKRYVCKSCNASVPVAPADALVEATLLDALAGDGWKALRAGGRSHDPEAIAFLTARLEHARERWLAGKDDDAEYDDTKDEINARIRAIKTAPVVILPDVDDIAAAWPTLPLEGKRQVITAAVESIVVMPYTPGANAFDRVIVTTR